MAIDARQWLRDWAHRRLGGAGYVNEKSDMREAARACAADAQAAGISIAELKEAAGGDLERYLVAQENAEADKIVRG